jgi:acyl carrier protein
MTPQYDTIIKIIEETLGVEAADITPQSDFYLDLNATPEELEKIKVSLETSLDIILPELNQESLTTVADLAELVEDQSL